MSQTLLDVQDHDTRLDQIRHRREHLPERGARDDLLAGLATVDVHLGDATTRRDELGRQQKRLDDEIASITAKRTAVNDALYSGTVTNARELQDMSEEIEALSRRITHLEDQDLEVMEQLEPVDARLGELAEERARLTEALTAAELHLTAAETELAVELDQETASRDTAASAVPAALLAEYDTLRGGRGGIGVARLIGTQCGGCHLTLSAMEAARIRKHPEEVTHCEECGRLLVP